MRIYISYTNISATWTQLNVHSNRPFFHLYWIESSNEIIEDDEKKSETWEENWKRIMNIEPTDHNNNNSTQKGKNTKFIIWKASYNRHHREKNVFFIIYLFYWFCCSHFYYRNIVRLRIKYFKQKWNWNEIILPLIIIFSV